MVPRRARRGRCRREDRRLAAGRWRRGERRDFGGRVGAGVSTGAIGAGVSTGAAGAGVRPERPVPGSDRSGRCRRPTGATGTWGSRPRRGEWRPEREPPRPRATGTGVSTASGGVAAGAGAASAGADASRAAATGSPVGCGPISAEAAGSGMSSGAEAPSGMLSSPLVCPPELGGKLIAGCCPPAATATGVRAGAASSVNASALAVTRGEIAKLTDRLAGGHGHLVRGGLVGSAIHTTPSGLVHSCTPCLLSISAAPPSAASAPADYVHGVCARKGPLAYPRVGTVAR